MTKADEFKRGWGVILASTLGVGFGLSPLPFYTIGVLAEPLSQEFGWQRGDIMFGTFFMTMGSILMAPLIGWISDRHGVRTIALVSIVGLALGMASFTLLTPNILSLYGLFMLTTVIGAGSLPLTFSRAINAWFDKGRGMALGLGLAGTGLCGFIAPSYTVWLLENYGWQGAYYGLALLPLVLSLPFCIMFLKDTPPEAQAAADAKPGTISDALNYGLDAKTAFASFRFWLMAIAFCLVSVSIGGLVATMTPILMANGFPRADAAALAGILGISVILGRIVAGYLIDHFWAPLIAAIFLSIPAAACVILAHGELGLVATGFAVALVGLASGAEFDLMAYLSNRYFGMKAYGRIYGGLYAFFGIGAGIGPFIFGRVFDQTGNYDLALDGAAVLFVLPALALLFLGKYPVWTKAHPHDVTLARSEAARREPAVE
jgi:MFS family permease